MNAVIQYTCCIERFAFTDLNYSKPIFGHFHGLCDILEGVRGNHLVAFRAQTAGNGVRQCGHKDAVIPIGRKVFELSSGQLYCILLRNKGTAVLNFPFTCMGCYTLALTIEKHSNEVLTCFLLFSRHSHRTLMLTSKNLIRLSFTKAGSDANW